MKQNDANLASRKRDMISRLSLMAWLVMIWAVAGGSYANGVDKFGTTGGVPVSKPAIGEEPVLQDINISTVANGKIKIDLVFSQPVNPPKSFSTDEPETKLILDFVDVRAALQESKQDVAIGVVQGFDVVGAGERTRVLFDLREPVTYQIREGGDHIYVDVTPKSVVGLKAQKSRYTAVKEVPPAHEILGIDFRRDEEGTGRVIVSLSDPNMGINVVERGKDIVIDFIDTCVPEYLQRRLDVTDFGTPVVAVITRSIGGNVQMKVENTGVFQQLAYQVNNQFVIDISPDQEAQITPEEEEKRYTGERLSLNFQDVQVRAVLQLLAEFTGINIVASDSVQGSMTLRLNNVPWDEALAIILRTQGLAQREVGNILLIAPAEEVAAREKEALESRKEVKELAPLVTKIIPLNYAKADEMASLLKDNTTSILSPRGTVSVDTRTNTLLVQDTDANLIEVTNLVNTLDVPVKQVLIEARIVNVDTNFEKDLGIRWGITKPTHVSGTITGASQMQQNVIEGNNPLLDVAFPERLNINLPAEPTTGTAGTFGVALAKLGKGYLLDLEISAIESEGIGELISSPRLVTANQQEAYIEQGEEIPYQQATSSGATAVEFKKAVLGLRVTPQITPDGNVILTLKINQDRRSSQPEVLGVPAIDTQQIETLVLVDNGETIVLGGVYKEDKQHKVSRVPFLGTLPVVGNLFKVTQDINDRSELLIFITPRIIQQTPIT